MAKKKGAGKTPATEAAEAVEAPAKMEQPKQPTQNGVTRPRGGTATGRVWEISDELSAQAGGPAPRADVLKAFEAEGGNSATGATQYGRWRKFHGLESRQRAPQAATANEDAPEVESAE
jgi:hypothetical protein